MRGEPIEKISTAADRIAQLELENERLRTALQQIADDPDMDITATHIAKNALAQSR